jgi:DNA adenine methylase
MKSPFPYFGGKSRAAAAVWQRFGDVANYVEPFAGSLAVLLQRPHEPKTETVNDLDCYLSNFWRALAADPMAVAAAADWPVNEADLHARHLWLVGREEFRALMKADPDFYDVKIAGWWVWGICQWIGSGWCAERNYYDAAEVDRGALPKQQLPHLGNAGMGIYDYFAALSARLRRVRVCCGDWERVTGDSVTFRHGVTGVLLDPPYADSAGRQDDLYGMDSLSVAHDVREWAIANGDNPLLRIALCGYEGEHTMPDGWTVHEWKAPGGFGSQGNGNGRANAARERIWFSPHCLPVHAPMSLFAMGEL